MCRLPKIAMRDYQKSVTTGQTDKHQAKGSHVPLCFAGDTKIRCICETQMPQNVLNFL